MKATTTLCAALLAMLVAGCPDKDKHESIELTRKGVEAFNNDSWDRSIQFFKDATHKSEGNHLAWYSMGEAQSKQEDWKEAADSYAQAVKHSPGNAQYHLRLGMALYELELKERNKALAEAKAAAKGQPVPYRQMGDLSKSEAELNEAIKINKDLFNAHWYLGRVYRDTGRPKQAAEAWTNACRLNPHYGPPFSALGQLYIDWDRFDEAIRVLTQGQQYVDGAPEKSDIYYRLGLAYTGKARLNPAEEKENLDKAVDAFSKSLELRADLAEAKLQRGIAYAKRGDKSKAQADLDDYLKRGAGNAFERQEATKALYSLSL
jgi:tetratricopeptide (TPR) repeat protein